MKTAQKIKLIPVLCLLWALPMSLLPRVTAKSHATAAAKGKHINSRSEAELKLATDTYGKLPLSFERNEASRPKQCSFFHAERVTHSF